MDFSIFFAKLFGLYMLIICFLLVVRKHQIKNLIGEFIASPGLILTSGICRLVFGLGVVLVHPIWIMDWQVAITILGYLFLLTGIIRIGFQEQTRAFWGCMLQEKGYWISCAILLIVGAYLTYHGFVS